jgi:hypothetical protein
MRDSQARQSQTRPSEHEIGEAGNQMDCKERDVHESHVAPSGTRALKGPWHLPSVGNTSRYPMIPNCMGSSPPELISVLGDMLVPRNGYQPSTCTTFRVHFGSFLPTLLLMMRHLRFPSSSRGDSRPGTSTAEGGIEREIIPLVECGLVHCVNHSCEYMSRKNATRNTAASDIERKIEFFGHR